MFYLPMKRVQLPLSLEGKHDPDPPDQTEKEMKRSCMCCALVFCESARCCPSLNVVKMVRWMCTFLMPLVLSSQASTAEDGEEEEHGDNGALGDDVEAPRNMWKKGAT